MLRSTRWIQLRLCLTIGCVLTVNAGFAQTPLTLKEEWRIGGSEDEIVFGVIADCARDSGGQTYVLDQQLALVHIVNAHGRVVGTMGGSGEGPGEFSNPREIMVMADGNILVLQPSPSRVSVFTPQGDYKKELRIPARDKSGTMVAGIAAIDDGIVVHDVTTSQDQNGMRQRQTITAIQLGAAVAETELCSAERVFKNGAVVVREREMVPFQWVAYGNRICVNNGWRFDIIEWANGKPLCRINSVDPPRSRNGQERGAVESYIRGGGGTTGARIEVEETDRDIQWLGITNEYAVWVLTSQGARSAKAGILGTFEVFDEAGKLVGKFVVKGDGLPSRDRLVMENGYLYVLTRYAYAFANWRSGRTEGENGSENRAEIVDDGDLEPMGVVCYRVPSLAELKAAIE